VPGNPEDQHIEMGCSRDTTTVEIAGFGSSPESGNTEVDVVSTNGSGQSHTMVSGDEVDGVGGVANFAGQVEQPPVTTQGPTGDDDVPAGPNPVSDGVQVLIQPDQHPAGVAGRGVPKTGEHEVDGARQFGSAGVVDAIQQGRGADRPAPWGGSVIAAALGGFPALFLVLGVMTGVSAVLALATRPAVGASG
jgi:hypothetical protein